MNRHKKNEDFHKTNHAAFLAAFVCLAFSSVHAASKEESAARSLQERLIASVEAGKCTEVADLIEFPVDYWSVRNAKGIREVAIKNRQDFVDHCSEYVDPFVRSRIGKAKLERLDGGRYVLTWSTKELEFTYEFERRAEGDYRITHYDIGPR